MLCGIHLHYLSMMKLLGSCLESLLVILFKPLYPHGVSNQMQFVRKIKAFRLWMRDFETVNFCYESPSSMRFNEWNYSMCIESIDWIWDFLALREHEDIEFLESG